MGMQLICAPIFYIKYQVIKQMLILFKINFCIEKKIKFTISESLKFKCRKNQQKSFWH